MEFKPARLTSKAIQADVDLAAWQVGRIRKTFDEDDSGTPGVPHEEVVAWLE